MKPRALAALEGPWTGDEGTLRVTAAKCALDVDVFGAAVSSIFGSEPTAQSGDAPEEDPLQWARDRALTIVAELEEGKTDALAEELLPHIPKAWPSQVLRSQWPDQEQRCGKLKEARAVAAWFDPATSRMRVWIELERARAVRWLEVAFVGTALSIFDVNVRRAPASVRVAPVDRDRFVAFDFRPDPRVEIRVLRKGKEIEVRSRSGVTMRFRKAKER